MLFYISVAKILEKKQCKGENFLMPHDLWSLMTGSVIISIAFFVCLFLFIVFCFGEQSNLRPRLAWNCAVEVELLVFLPRLNFQRHRNVSIYLGYTFQACGKRNITVEEHDVAWYRKPLKGSGEEGGGGREGRETGEDPVLLASSAWSHEQINHWWD